VLLDYYGSYTGDLTGIDPSGFYGTEPFAIGAAYEPGRGYSWRALDGEIDEFMIHGKVLSGAEIEELYALTDSGTSGIEAPAEGGDMWLVSEAIAWDDILASIRAYAMITNAIADTNYFIDVSLDGKTNWTQISATTSEGNDGTYYRYSGTGTASSASGDELYWRIRTTNDVAREFHALGIVGDAQ